MLGIGQLECVSYDVVCGMFYCDDCEKALINKVDRQECKLRVELCKPVIETHFGPFWEKNPLIYARRSNFFYAF